MRPAVYLRQELPTVGRRWTWFWWGVALQAAGLAIPIGLAVQRSRHDGLSGSLTRATVRLIWHQMLQHTGDIALIALGVVVFVAGSMVLARPLVSVRYQLVLAVPIAALFGVVVLGVVALIVAVLVAAADNGLADVGDISWMPSGRRRDDDDER